MSLRYHMVRCLPPVFVTIFGSWFWRSVLGGVGRDIPFERNVPVLMNSRFTTFSLLLMCRHISSTFFSRLVSDLMKLKVPSGFNALHSPAIRSPASCERPMK